MSSQWKIQCLRRGKTLGAVPTGHVKLLCQRLFKKFEKNPKIKKAHSVDPHISDLNLVFTGMAESQKLNRRYRRKNRATDVLSFASEAPSGGLGELVICMPVIRRQAREARHSLKKELEIMVIHGFLHLLGYDHEKNHKEELKMKRLQDRLLRLLT